MRSSIFEFYLYQASGWRAVMGFRGKVEEIMPALNADMVIDDEQARRARLTIVSQGFSAEDSIDLMEMLGIMPFDKEKEMGDDE